MAFDANKPNLDIGSRVSDHWMIECGSRVCAFGCTSDHEPWLCCRIEEVFAHGKA